MADDDDQWRWDERDIDGGFSGCEFPRLWPPRRHLRAPESPATAPTPPQATEEQHDTHGDPQQTGGDR